MAIKINLLKCLFSYTKTKREIFFDIKFPLCSYLEQQTKFWGKQEFQDQVHFNSDFETKSIFSEIPLLFNADL